MHVCRINLSWAINGTGSAELIALVLPGVHLPFDGGSINIATTPPEFPFGKRGVRPVRFDISDEAMSERLHGMRIPGVTAYNRTFRCAWDSALIVADVVGATSVLEGEHTRRAQMRVPFPGLERYKALGLKETLRDYQKEAVEFLALRSYGIEGDPTRAGKCLVIEALATLLDSKKVLIVCPALAKYVWASEILKWLKEESILLFGKAGTEARIYCGTCDGRGAVSMGVVREDGAPEMKACRACRARNGQSLGERVIEVHDLVADTASRRWQESSSRLKKDGTPRMVWRSARYCPVPAVYRCPVHSEVTSSSPGQCMRCRDDLAEVIANHRFIICNYDILTALKDKDGRGRGFMRDDLPGWAPWITRYHFDMAVADEAHRLRGWQGKLEARAQSRRERFCEVVDAIERVYLVTATPIYGFTRDVWALCDAMSKGLFS